MKRFGPFYYIVWRLIIEFSLDENLKYQTVDKLVEDVSFSRKKKNNNNNKLDQIFQRLLLIESRLSSNHTPRIHRFAVLLIANHWIDYLNLIQQFVLQSVATQRMWNGQKGKREEYENNSERKKETDSVVVKKRQRPNIWDECQLIYYLFIYLIFAGCFLLFMTMEIKYEEEKLTMQPIWGALPCVLEALTNSSVHKETQRWNTIAYRQQQHNQR